MDVLRALCLSLVLACTGSIGSPESSPDRPELIDDPSPPSGRIELGRSVLRRTNAREFHNAARDLLALDVELTLPADQKSGRGYDTDGTSLLLSSDAVTTYVEAAEQVARLAVNTAPAFAACDTIACVEEATPEFLKLAFRGPVEDGSERLLARLVEPMTNVDEAIEATILFALLSPHFIFHRPDQSEADPVDDYVLADRLASTLWSSHPDTELLELAASGSLRDPDVLVDQVERLLSDPRSDRFIEDFTKLWIRVEGLERRTGSDEELALYRAMATETHLFVADVLRNGRLTDLLTAEYTFVDARLAAHYGIEGTFGDGFERVELPAERRGLLTHASLLALHSPDNVSDPIRRGVFVADVLLCVTAAEGVPDVEPLMREDDAQTVREILAEHRSNPVCATCHARTDPIGLSLEVFDAMGVHRDLYPNGREIEVADELYTGERFDDVYGLIDILASQQQLSACMGNHIASYSLGRDIDDGEEAVMARAFETLRDEMGEDIRFVDLVVAFIRSPLFSQRETEL